VTPALSVDAELVVEHDGRRFRVWGEDDRLVFDAPSLSALRGLPDVDDLLPATDALPVDGVGPVSSLADAGLTVEVRARRARVATVGAGVTGDPVGRRLTGVDAALDWRGVATAAVRALG